MLGKGLAILGLLVYGLVEQDDARNVFGEFFVGGEKKFTISTTILFVVFEVDSGKTLADSASALISSENTLAWSDNLLGILSQFLQLIGWQVRNEAGHG